MTSGEYERYLEKPNPYGIVRSKEKDIGARLQRSSEEMGTSGLRGPPQKKLSVHIKKDWSGRHLQTLCTHFVPPP